MELKFKDKSDIVQDCKILMEDGELVKLEITM